MKKEKNEELQSRREFFKKAAKGALPILGAIVLAGAPGILNAAEHSPMGCSSDGCSYTCKSSCYNDCKGSCKGCTGCNNTCQGFCKAGCYTSNK